MTFPGKKKKKQNKHLDKFSSPKILHINPKFQMSVKKMQSRKGETVPHSLSPKVLNKAGQLLCKCYSIQKPYAYKTCCVFCVTFLLSLNTAKKPAFNRDSPSMSWLPPEIANSLSSWHKCIFSICIFQKKKKSKHNTIFKKCTGIYLIWSYFAHDVFSQTCVQKKFCHIALRVKQIWAVLPHLYDYPLAFSKI